MREMLQSVLEQIPQELGAEAAAPLLRLQQQARELDERMASPAPPPDIMLQTFHTTVQWTLDDGRLTDGKGETVYFSEAIIIFTSNLGTLVAAGEEGARRQPVAPEMSYARLREVILEAIRQHFNLELGRPEILNRFGDNFVVFDFIHPPVDEQILDHLLQQLATSLLEQHKLLLRLPEPVREQLVALGRSHLGHGGRGIRNSLEAALVNPWRVLCLTRPWPQAPRSG